MHFSSVSNYRINFLNTESKISETDTHTFVHFIFGVCFASFELESKAIALNLNANYLITIVKVLSKDFKLFLQNRLEY